MDTNFKVTMNEYLPLRDVVFNTLRQAILKGELQPGERLMEIQLATKLGVSRTPVREAIRKLELEGLVLMIPRKGAEVADITEKSLRDVLEVRQALEELAVQLACDKITEEEIEELKKEYIEISDNTRRATIKKHCDMVKRIQNKLLEQIEQISLYRINNNFISSGEINFFVELLYFILSRVVIEKQDVKYEPCFSIIASIINNNVLDKHYQEIIERII